LLLRRYALAGIVGVLLSAPLIVPFAHFLPEFTKEYDPAIKSGQPLVYVPLNLVIDDYDFYTSTSLQKLPFPEINVNFLGWIPVLLAVWGFFGSGNREIRRAILFLGATSTLAMLVASGEPLRLLASIPVQWISDLGSGVRHPGQIVGLSVLPVLGLAGIGTDRLLTGTSKKISLVLSGDNWRLPPFSFDLGLLVAIPLLFALNQTRAFGTHWIYSTPLSPAVPVTVEALRTPSLEWVNPPYGEHEWIESAVRAGLKLSYGYRTWDWKNRSSPEPILWAQYANVPADMTVKSTVAGIPVYVARPEREYALVTHADGAQTICTALGIGGDIDVTCNISRPGDLEVKENSWEGWFLTVDGTAAELLPGRWLAVSLTAGNHHIGFRYRPWDVPLGIALAVVGVGVSIYCWRKREDPTEDLPEYHV
jgi:hypothetical protein